MCVHAYLSIWWRIPGMRMPSAKISFSGSFRDLETERMGLKVKYEEYLAARASDALYTIARFRMYMEVPEVYGEFGGFGRQGFSLVLVPKVGSGNRSNQVLEEAFGVSGKGFCESRRDIAVVRTIVLHCPSAS